MPQIFNDAVMTNDGRALLSREMAGECNIQVTRMAIGSGIYMDSEKTMDTLQKRAALKSEVQSTALSSLKRIDKTSIIVSGVFTNDNVTTAYHINEIGLFAQEKGNKGTEVLYSIAVVAEKEGEIMPASEGKNPIRIIHDWIVSVSNSASATIECLPDGAFAMASNVGDVDDLDTKEKNNLVSAVNETLRRLIVTDTSGVLGKKGAEIEAQDLLDQIADMVMDKLLLKTGDVSNTTVTFEETEKRINIFSTDSLKVIMGKIKKWFTDLKPVAFSGKYSDLDATGYITTLTNFSQINNTYRHWKIAEIDSTYASQLGIERNTGDFNVLVLDYNGDGITFNYGNMILASPRLGNDHYLVQMWRAEALVTYHRGNVPALTNNLLATVAGTALDAAQGKALYDMITQINSDLSKMCKTLSGYLLTGTMTINFPSFRNFLLILHTGVYLAQTYTTTMAVTQIIKYDNLSFESSGLTLKITLSDRASIYFSILDMGEQRGKDYTNQTITL